MHKNNSFRHPTIILHVFKQKCTHIAWHVLKRMDVDSKRQFKLVEHAIGGRHSIHSATKYTLMGRVSRQVARQHSRGCRYGCDGKDVFRFHNIHRLKVGIILNKTKNEDSKLHIYDSVLFVTQTRSLNQTCNCVHYTWNYRHFRVACSTGNVQCHIYREIFVGLIFALKRIFVVHHEHVIIVAYCLDFHG